ncbi:MAG TPA: hypothetical protein VET48_05170 [Steroidobacteraceae bacterium]|nr:hypothetical protein [Steroidobacteraceae bacterium]
MARPLKVLVSVFSCHSMRHFSDAQRATWLGFCGRYRLDHRVFFGQGGEAKYADEVILNCPDDYKSMCLKSHAIFEWALNHNYDFVLNCSNDAYVRVDNFVASDFHQHDYVGFALQSNLREPLVYAHGGCGYVVSKRAMEFLVAATPPENDSAEDYWVAETLLRHGISLYGDWRYADYRIARTYVFDGVSRPSLPPEMMSQMIASAEHPVQQQYQMHEQWLKDRARKA